MTMSAAVQTGQEAGTSSAKQSAGMGDTDSTFVKKAAQGGLAEVELGQLAAQKASTEEVRKFGQRMVDDHTKANEQLKQVAAEKNIELPQQLDAKDKAMKARLEKLSGEQFDRAYMKDMVKDHQKDVAEFQRASNVANDPAIKNFAQQSLPTLKDHLKEAQKIAPKQQQAERTSGQ
jgi:putative membrane protein